VTSRVLLGRPERRATGGRHKSKARFAAVLLIVSAAGLASTTSASGDSSAIAAKQAEVQSVLDQIQQLDGSLEQAIEAYNLATDKLRRIEASLRVNAHELHVARTNLKRSQRALSNRLVTIYTSGDDASALSILLGAGSIDEMLNQIETVNRVSSQDVQINKQVLHFRAEVRARRLELQNAHEEQRSVVQQRANQKASIESQLSERRQLVSSIRSEIVRMKAEEAARQRELGRQARERALAAASAPQIVSSPTPPSTDSSSSSSSSSSAPTVAPPPGNYSGVVAIAMRYLGTPYVWGGASPSGFDCSGLVQYVFAQVGVSLPHNAAAQYGYGSPVSMSQLQPGDLVFFYGLGHVGIYIGGGQFIHAPHTGDVVKISSLSGYYASVFVGARRL
jgi:cell wall-associated NlpC family hydrolase